MTTTANHSRIGIVVLAVLSLFCSGCIGAAAMFGYGFSGERLSDDQRIGYQSRPVTVPQFGELRLQVFPLNANDRRGKQPFVICFASWGKMGVPKEKIQTLSIDPKMILLTMPSGNAIKPSGYAVAGVCPYSEFARFLPSRALAFGEINVGEPIVWESSRSIPGEFPNLALRFDVVTPGAKEKFSLRIGSLAVDGATQDVPTIEFAPHYGRISRFPQPW